MNITLPPALIIPGTIAETFRTMTMEVSKTYEGYNDLFDDAAIKHFSAQTTTPVGIRVKLYSG
jgi:hypothetical protein